MAEVASGAVSALLGVIRNEALLLGGVQGDVQFIKEEMESINSFLMHLARTVPPSGEHDEQVRTWMSQVRLLAQDCNNCIDLYLYRGNPDIHLAKGGFWRYLMWAPWFLRKTMAQRSAAIRLRELKERARDVGDRRMRYGVEVPAKAAAASGQSPSRAAAISTHVAGEGTGDEEQDGGDQLVATVIDHSDRRAFELCSWEDYFKLKLQQWMEDIAWLPIYPPSIAIMASDTHQNDEACALACEALDAGQVHHVLVDIPFVHFYYNPLRPKEILYYILRELQLQQARSQPKAKQQETTSSGQDKGEEQQSQHISKWREERTRKDDIYREQKKFFSEINDNIQQLKLYDKLENVKSEILLVKGDQLQPYLGQIKDDSLEHKVSKEPLGVLLLLLKLAATEQDQLGKKKPKRTLAAFYEDIIEATTLKLKEHIEAGTEQSSLICLSSAQYEHILREMFPKTRDNNAQEQDKNITATTIHEDHIKEITDKVKQDIIREVFPILMTSNSKALQDQDQEQDSSAAKHATMRTLGEDSISSHVAKQETRQGVKEDKGHMIQAIGKQAGHCEIPNSMVHETTEKIDNMKWMIKAQMKIKRIVDNIEQYLKDYTMIILKVDETIDGYLWEETRKALRLLSCMAGALIITTTRSTHQAKEYCCGQWEPIDCSLVGLYHATVLKLTSQKMQQDNCNPQLFHDILDNCDPHEFCMKMFARALYSKPTRSYEELYNLCTTLQAVSPKSLSSIAQKMIKFSYNDLPKEYKSCLLYLAIFPQGHRIRRSTLIGRWVVEGLITTEDWSWPSSVDKAERCFEMLINRWLIYPADIGVTGGIKSCMVGDLVYEFITTIAKKQRTVQIRLSHHLARHFSISNDLRLRGSDTVSSFLKKLSESSQFSLLKVLDLETCKCFGGKNKHYLKDICCKILLLKYLSLKRTDVTHLPKEINNLHELEVLDIRHTKVSVYATRNVSLLKLKRLLVGYTDPSPSNTYTGTTFKIEEYPRSVQVPDKIEKMLDMEVLSNVTAPSSQALKDIGELCQLRKLGVVIEEKVTHLQNLLVAISNMHECLQSLSITIIPITGHKCTFSRIRTPSTANNDYGLSYPPKVLKSLSIIGTTQKVQLLQKLLENDGCSKLVKVTLCGTCLNQDDLNVLAKLSELLCMRLGDKAYTESKLIFKNNEFNKLKFFHVEGSNMAEISFGDGAVPELEKIVLSSANDLKSVFGVEGLSKLKELELNNNKLLTLFDKANQIAKVTLLGTFLRQGDLQILARKPNMHCLVLLENSYIEGHLSFNKEEFPKLNLLTIDNSHIANISFNCGSTPKLKKIIWSLTKDIVVTLSGINNLSRLKEFELNGESIPNEVQEAIKRHRNKPILKHNKPKNQE